MAGITSTAKTLPSPFYGWLNWERECQFEHALVLNGFTMTDHRALFLPPPWGLYFVLNENLLCYIVSGFLYGLIECSQSSVAEAIVLEATVALYMEHLPTYIERSMHSGDYLLGSPIPGKEQWRNIDEMSKFGCCFPGIGDPRTKSPLWWLQMRV